MSAAAARLTNAGFRVSLNDGRLEVSPSAKLTDELRGYIRLHLVTIKAELALQQATPSYIVWRVLLSDGDACTAIRPAGATHGDMLATVREQFGAERVLSIEPGKQSAVQA